MPLEMRADFLFGYYQGHSWAGALEDAPSPERLHSALLAGACSLERQEGKHPDQGIDSLDRRLFDWLEGHVPDAISLPILIPQESDATAYRNKGEVERYADGRKKACVATARTFLDGPISWSGGQGPSTELVQRLGAIAREVPYLGEAASSVILSVVESSEVPETALRRCDPKFDVRTFKAADTGHTEELVDFFRQRQLPVKRDKRRKKEEEESLQFNFTCLRDVYYERPEAGTTSTNVPWPHGYALRVEGRRLGREEYVAASVCLHKAIVSRFGDALPRILQRAGYSPLSNGLGIQVISPEVPNNCLSTGDGSDYLLVMFPQGTLAADEMQIARVLSGIQKLYSRRLGAFEVTFTGEWLDLGEFWDPAPSGAKRLFTTEPLFIPDSRPPSKPKDDGTAWTVDDDARVAFGHVWRDLGLSVDAGDQGRVDLSRKVADMGIAIGGGRIVPTSNIRSYVHHTNRGSVLLGEWAAIDMGVMNCDRCVSAIGQTRHLGGGLLVPMDIPQPNAASSGRGGREWRVARG